MRYRPSAAIRAGHFGQISRIVRSHCSSLARKRRGHEYSTEPICRTAQKADRDRLLSLRCETPIGQPDIQIESSRRCRQNLHGLYSGREYTVAGVGSNPFSLNDHRIEKSNSCRLFVAYELSAALTHFRLEDWRKIRTSRGFEQYFR